VAADYQGLEDSCLYKHRANRVQRKIGKKAQRDCIVVLKYGTVSRIGGVEVSWTERLN
jgi:hypothetical protein